MADMSQKLDLASRWLALHRGLLLPVLAAALIFVILVPLPPGLMDVLLVANITLAAVVLLTTIYVSSPLEFSVFPSVLLGATLLRLVLNVASTRLILTAGAAGHGVEQAQFAAGKVIWSFSQFVTSGSLAVGVIIFAIVVIVQFIVVTRGAARVSEVAARFVLDAMPGKQMAIDADLNASLINADQARKRRDDIASEAEFYGAMDGASKFLRGDAIAAVLITLVNILGGLYVGMVQYGWNWPQTLELFTRLTVGDGLVTQIPAFIVAVSAALIVTRTRGRTNLGEEVVGQLVSRPVVLVVTALFLLALAATGLPKAPLLMMGVGCAGLAYVLSRSRRRDGGQSEDDRNAPALASPDGDDLQSLLTVHPMQIELGYALVRLVEPADDGDLLGRITALRRGVAEQLGLLVPPIHIRDNMKLSAHSYVIKIRGGKVASGRIYPAQLLAVGGDGGESSLGRQTTEPAFGTPAVWIAPDQRQRAEATNYTVIAPAGVLITHLREVINRHAADLLSRQQVAQLLEGLAGRADSLVKEGTETLTIGRIQKVLQNLLRERVPIRDMETILETLLAADRTDSVELLTDCVRSALGRTLTQQYCGEDGQLHCVCLESELEGAIGRYVSEGGPAAAAVPPDLAGKLTRTVADGLTRLRRQGRPPVVLCGPPVRVAVRDLIISAHPDAAVLGYNEIDGAEVKPVAKVESQS